MVMTFFIVIAGIEKGIEKYAKILMPILLVLLFVIAIRAITLPKTDMGNPIEGLVFLFKPDFSKLDANVIFAALGQAFFSLSIGMGALITYGSYINKKDNLGSSAVIVSMADTFIAILAGVAIFPAVFAFGFSPEAGTGLVFQVLPNIFQKMAGGYFIGILFFLLLTVAALTSSISLLEVVVTTFVEEFKLSRKKASAIAAILITLLGIVCALSWSVFKNIAIGEVNFFGMLDFIALKIILPLGGLFIVLFVGWFYGKGRIWREISNRGKLKVAYLHIYMFLVKYIAPIAIAVVFLNGLGILKF
jgi:NSS family neurotransmitter:Na+ symporter